VRVATGETDSPVSLGIDPRSRRTKDDESRRQLAFPENRLRDAPGSDRNHTPTPDKSLLAAPIAVAVSHFHPRNSRPWPLLSAALRSTCRQQPPRCPRVSPEHLESPSPSAHPPTNITMTHPTVLIRPAPGLPPLPSPPPRASFASHTPFVCLILLFSILFNYTYGYPSTPPPSPLSTFAPYIRRSQLRNHHRSRLYPLSRFLGP
jgi:hypothetical protein